MQKKNMERNIDFDKNGYCKDRDSYRSSYYATKAFNNNEHNKGCNTYDIKKRPILRKTEQGEYTILGETVEIGYEKVIKNGNSEN